MNAKQQSAFDAMVTYSTMLRFPFDSSSQKMENALLAMGVALPVKLYHEYKYPDGVNAMQYERIVESRVFVSQIFNRNQVLNPIEFYLGEFKKSIELYDYDKSVLDILYKRYVDDATQFYKHLSKLNGREQTELADYIDALIPESVAKMRGDVELLKTLNHALRNVHVDLKNINKVIDFLHGVAYGYAPEELDYFLNTDMERRNKETAGLYAQLKSFGVQPSYIIRPDRVEKIIKSILLARNIKKTKERTRNG